MPTENASWLWSTFADGSTLPVMAFTRDGRVAYANESARAFMSDGRTLLGRTLADLFGEEQARERLDLIAQVLDTGRTTVLEEFRRGKHLRCVLHTIPGPGPRPNAVLMIAHLAAMLPSHNGHELVRAKTNDASPISRLTSRELEILKLIGVGMSTIDIAKHLGRSVKTIEWHRVSLGDKLGVVNRVELARIAIAAGLVGLDDRMPTNAASTDE
jgi:DNA-binding CsgD family transcriptional regulator